MLCPSCGKSISDDSQFCSYCGNTIKTIAQKTNPDKNSNLPVLIKRANEWFEENMVPAGRAFDGYGFSPLINRNFGIAFQLIDEKEQTTAYDGSVWLNVDIKQGVRRAETGRRKFSKRFQAKANEFTSTDSGLWYIYNHPEVISLFTEGTHYGTIEIYFLPEGGKKKLYKVANIQTQYNTR